MKNFLLFSIAALTLFAIQSEARSTQQRQQHQAKRIGEGVKSGQLSQEEARGLASQQSDIQNAKREARKSGGIDADERTKLKQMQNDASKNIHEQKHDTEKR